MNIPRSLGIHLRFQESLAQILQEADALGLHTFQFFLAKSNKEFYGRQSTLTAQDIDLFLAAQATDNRLAIIHSSYWINLATGKEDQYANSRALLRRELETAEQLNVPFLVLHPGSATGYELPPEAIQERRELGIKALTDVLNELLPLYPKVTLVLENTAHGNTAIGSDFEDFVLIKQHLATPEQVKFCIDTAHAHAYGYDLRAIDSFLAMVDATMGLSNIALFHFNDSQEQHGLKKDQHAVPGEGLIGKKTLLPYLYHPQLAHAPKILELPKLPLERMQSALIEVANW